MPYTISRSTGRRSLFHPGRPTHRTFPQGGNRMATEREKLKRDYDNGVRSALAYMGDNPKPWDTFALMRRAFERSLERIEEQEGQVARLVEDKRMLELGRDQLNARVEELIGQLERMTESRDYYSRRYGDEYEKIRELERKIASQNQTGLYTANQALAQMVKDLTAERDALQNENTCIRSDRDEVVKQRDFAKNQLKDAENLSLARADALRNSQNELRDLKLRPTPARIIQLEDKVQRLLQERAALAEMNKTQWERSALEEMNKTQRDRIHALRLDNREAAEKIRLLDERVKRQDYLLDEARVNYAETQAKLNDLNSTVDTLRQQRDKAWSDVDTLETRVKELNTELSNKMTRTVRPPDVRELESEVEHLKAELAYERGRGDRLNKLVDSLRTERDDALQKVQRVHDALDKARKGFEDATGISTTSSGGVSEGRGTGPY